MKDTRKDIRFALPASSASDFESAKRRAERELGVSMTNNEFARRAVVQAVRGAGDASGRADQPEQEMGTRSNYPRRPFLGGTGGDHENR